MKAEIALEWTLIFRYYSNNATKNNRRTVVAWNFCAKRSPGDILTKLFLQKTEILIFLNKKFSSESRRLIAHKNMGHTYVKKHSSAMILGELINFSNLFKKHSKYDTHSEHMETVVTTSQLLMF